MNSSVKVLWIDFMDKLIQCLKIFFPNTAPYLFFFSSAAILDPWENSLPGPLCKHLYMHQPIWRLNWTQTCCWATATPLYRVHSILMHVCICTCVCIWERQVSYLLCELKNIAEEQTAMYRRSLIVQATKGHKKDTARHHRFPINQSEGQVCL